MAEFMIAVALLFGLANAASKLKFTASKAAMQDVKKQFDSEQYNRPCVGAHDTQCSTLDHVTGQY